MSSSGSPFIPTFNPSTNRVGNLPCASSLQPYDIARNQTCDTDQTAGLRSYAFDPESRISTITMLNGSKPFETYSYDAGGKRIRKDNASGTFAEYTNFGGQPIAEKDQPGAWTDYIFANGKRIAKRPSADHRIHTRVFTSSNNVLGFDMPPPSNPDGTPYTVKAGDLLCFRQYNSNGVGGPFVHYSNGAITAWALADTNGAILNQFTPQNAWYNRCADISMNGATTGTQITDVSVLTDVWTGPGTWDIWYADMAIVSKDGTVTQVNIDAVRPGWISGERVDRDANGSS